MSNKSDTLKSMLELRGNVVLRVWWEPVTRPLEMCGHGGGWMAELKSRTEPLGLSFDAACEHIRESSWLNQQPKATP